MRQYYAGYVFFAAVFRHNNPALSFFDRFSGKKFLFVGIIDGLCCPRPDVSVIFVSNEIDN
jgi:hypothetical protein